MDSDALIAALGKKFEDQAVQTLVRELKMTKIPKIPKARSKESEDYLEAKDAGIHLGFTDADYLEGRKVARYGNADMILTGITVYAAGAVLLRIPEAHQIRRLLLGRLRRGPKT